HRCCPGARRSVGPCSQRHQLAAGLLKRPTSRKLQQFMPPLNPVDVRRKAARAPMTCWAILMPTMTVTIEEMAARWHKEKAEQRSRADARSTAMRALLPTAKQLLTDRYGARRVLLFGSLARGDMTERSDVDLAVDGL